MLRKGNEIKWNLEAKKYFEYIKVSLNRAPLLDSIDFTKDFIMFSLTSEHTIVGVLLQKTNRTSRNL